ncbi:TlpA family protein disulfide reductase, partial [Pontiella sp.]|uniref:TlpA family protein disulfide reductase n=1 Tax=Pontiella sp. TaxID=2837462 RepID=UPI00356847B3
MVLLVSLALMAGIANAQRPGAENRYANVPAGGVLGSGPLPDLNAFTPDGKPLKLRELCKGKYTVLSAGCLTCPLFHQNYPEIEAAAVDYAAKGVRFFYFYKSLRHPELNGYVQAQNMTERLLQLAEARKQLGTKVPWIADTLDDSMRIGLKAGSWSVYLISPEGEIIYAADRIDGPGLRRALGQAVGTVSPATAAGSLDLPRIKRPPQLVNTDSELGVKRPEGLNILSIVPATPEDTYYVKLRAEADDALLRTGTGRLFLGFYPDPILDAHWNNLAPPMKYTLTPPEGASATPATATAQKGPGDSDTLPRQFWVEIA